MMANLKLVCVLLVCMMVAAPISNAAISCNQVIGYFQPCLTYLKSGGAVPPNCCNGIRALNNATNTTPDRQQACNCLKTIAGNMTGINPILAAELPSKCGVNIPYKISISTNCQNVK